MAGAVSESELLMQCTEISDTGMHDSVMLLLTFVVYEVYHCAPPQRPHLTRCNIFDRYVCTSPCLGPKGKRTLNVKKGHKMSRGGISTP